MEWRVLTHLVVISGLKRVENRSIMLDRNRKAKVVLLLQERRYDEKNKEVK